MTQKIKLTDYLVKLLEEKNVKHVFMITGGGAMHLNDSFGKSKKIQYICNHHEQASAIAAEGYARFKNSLGVCVVTTGPGGTNAITGLVGSWLDSIPALYISGQVKLETTIGKRKLRQVGLQELPIVDIVKPVTKYAVMIKNPNEIRYHLEKAIYLAESGRPGPCWIDIPLDIQSAMINPDDLKTFDPKKISSSCDSKEQIKAKISKIIVLLKKAQRPVILAGNGIRLSGAVNEFITLVNKLKIPVLTAVTAHDLIPSNHPLFFGRPALHGERRGNFIVQNSDLLITIGTRLSLWTVSFAYQTFGQNAKHIMVDIDREELIKNTVHPEITICDDAKDFLNEFLNQIQKEVEIPLYTKWFNYCKRIKKKYPTILPEFRKQKHCVNSYYFIEVLGKHLKKDEVIVVGNGTAFTCTYQCIELKENQRLIGNIGCASMGYDLPASIGASFANKKKRVICITGDGSIQMNLQELQTIVHHKLPIKIFVLNNGGYLAIQNTQDHYFKSHYVGSSPESGISFPNILKIAKAYGIPAIRIKNHSALDKKIDYVLKKPGPVLCEIIMDCKQPLIPKVASEIKPDGSDISKPFEDMYPFLDRKEFLENMITSRIKKN